MENSIYLGLSKQLALRTNMDIIANNIANMSTPGYRAHNLMFQEFISDPDGTPDELSFVYDQRQYHITQPGAVDFTGNQLDVALEGPGFIGIQGPNGDIVYTRAGNFELSAEGQLITSSGFPVADAGGDTITIPDDSREINIDDRGFISNQDGVIGQLQIAEFENVQDLRPIGNNMYEIEGEAQAIEAQNTVVKQGLLESSNVKPIVEMTNMIDTLRTYQSVQRVLQTENERLTTAIRQLSRQN